MKGPYEELETSDATQWIEEDPNSIEKDPSLDRPIHRNMASGLQEWQKLAVVQTWYGLISVEMKKDWKYSEIGIDKSAAFDTIKSRNVLKLLTHAGCTEDEERLVRYLLANTKLRVGNSDMSVEFESKIGAF